ncbi:MAG TPA: VCBS repeat-containing protein, partial [Bacteroidales bacterium]|nr:VCBS repeat-containing protein [Bacteroidales bacterium]
MKILLTSFFLIGISYSSLAQFDPPQVIDPDVFGITKIVATDLNNDGFKDLITSQKYHSNDKISVFFNNGQENFSEQIILTTNIDTPEGVAAGDLNQDGWNDIAGISLDSNSLYWFPNADGSFPNEIQLDSGLIMPEDIEIVDIDNDGKPDIVVLDHTNIVVYYNLGNGNFNKITTPNDHFEYYAFSIADIDGDGYKDIIIGSGQVLVYMNDNGLFTTHDIVRSNSIANNGFCFMLHTADLDGNNSMDLIIDGNSNSEISWYANDGNGFFTFMESIENTIQCHSVTTADINEDGSIDILAALFQEGEIVWYANDGSG